MAVIALCKVSHYAVGLHGFVCNPRPFLQIPLVTIVRIVPRRLTQRPTRTFFPSPIGTVGDNKIALIAALQGDGRKKIPNQVWCFFVSVCTSAAVVRSRARHRGAEWRDKR
jgi:hypothetical protein